MKTSLKTPPFSYYIRSIRAILEGVTNPWILISLILTPRSRHEKQLHLRTGETFYIQSLMDLWVTKEVLIDRQYESASLPLQDGWTIVDIGAAFGDYSIWAARQVPSGRVVAVEPFPESVRLFRKNLLANKVTNVTVIEAAVSNRSGKSALNLANASPIMNSVVSTSGSNDSQLVTTISLKDLFTAADISTCDYLKMDCEGAEFDIIFSAPASLLRKLDRICMEVHDDLTEHSREDMVKFLEEHGYVTSLQLNPVHGDLALLYGIRKELVVPSK